MSARTDAAAVLRPLDVRTDIRQLICLGQTAFDYPWTEQEYRDKVRQWRNPSLVAEVGGTMAGWLIAEWQRDHLQLWLTAVSSQFARRRIGTQLVRGLKSLAADNGCDRIVAHVRETNLVAQLFLRSCEFKAVQVLRAFYPQKEDAFVMECAVAAEAGTRTKSRSSRPKIVRYDEDGFVD